MRSVVANLENFHRGDEGIAADFNIVYLPDTIDEKKDLLLLLYNKIHPVTHDITCIFRDPVTAISLGLEPVLQHMIENHYIGPNDLFRSE